MEFIPFVLIVFGIIVLVMVFQYINSKKSDKIFFNKLDDNFGCNDKSFFKSDKLLFAPDFFNRYKTNLSIDDMTWSDLSFDEVFSIMDSTQSDIGCQIMYYLLRTPQFDEHSVIERRKLINFWLDNPLLRKKIQLCLHRMIKMRKYSVYEYLDHICELKDERLTKYYIYVMLLFLSFIAMFFIGGKGIVLFVLIFIWNLYVYFRDKARLESYISVFRYILSIVESGVSINELLKNADEYPVNDSISTDLTDLKKFKNLASFDKGLDANSNPFIYLFNLLGSLFFVDIIRFWSLRKEIISHKDAIEDLVFNIGFIDAMIAFASYVYGNKNELCEAQFVNELSEITIDELYHPLLENPVKNSIVIDKGILLTGANASGKSTFIKSIAINMIFAQVLGYTCADKYQAPFVNVKSAMSNKDNIISGDSYYMAEVKSIKRMLDCVENVEDGISNVFFVDELFNGTNTEERIAASTQILRCLKEKGAFICAATHDIELTDLLNDLYNNYHFEEDLSRGDVKFSYKLKTGKAVSCNAIKLLAANGYPDEYVANAERMVEEHKIAGTWSL